jgi:hypothetical protein
MKDYFTTSRPVVEGSKGFYIRLAMGRANVTRTCFYTKAVILD